MKETKVFISYRRADAAREATEIEAALRKQHKQVFRDVSDIQVAERFPEKIKRAIEDADIVIVLIGPTWLNIRDERGGCRIDDPNDFVRREISFALRRMEPERFLDVVPVLLHDAKMPTAEALPNDIRALAEINALRVGHRTFKEDIVALSKRIDALRREQADRATKFLDELDEELGGRPIGDAIVSVKPAASSISELHDLPEFATWVLRITSPSAGFLGRPKITYEVSFETKESGFFEGHLTVPKKGRIEGHWSLRIGKGGTLVLDLQGSTFSGEDLNWRIPIERRAGERSYSGTDEVGNFYRLEWLRRGEASKNRF